MNGREQARLEDLAPGAIVRGVAGGPVTVIDARWIGNIAVTLTFQDEDGRLDQRTLQREDEVILRVEQRGRSWSFEADPVAFRFAVEAQRIRYAHLFEPYLALSSSQVRPLPHQIEAVYNEMLPRQPLRYLLADDPGAGKTIMAGLFIKEAMIRGDVERCLIVAPGSLVYQWEEELREKFGLVFTVVGKDALDSVSSGDVFRRQDRLIVRIDQIARREDLVERLAHAEWDLVVVDEAHRMAAHFGQDVRKTKRYVLGETLGATTRHLLLMTATPHSGKEEDFQLFLALLDSDRFEGRFRDGVHVVDSSDLMRRMVKEKLLTFEGKPLFPERRATTVEFELSAGETELYDAVTEYVRDEMNRADRLVQEGDTKRGNIAGFAVTMLQRRLASSPEAIYRSLRRRRERLERQVADEKLQLRIALRFADIDVTGRSLDLVMDPDDLDLEADEREPLEDEVVDAATTAATIEELRHEIIVLQQLEDQARRVRESNRDTKWLELRSLLADEPELFDSTGARRKLLIFTEHRDTLDYLVRRLQELLGNADAVIAIHGGTGRDARRALQARFTQDDACLILVATDAAGEGINLQRAHLVINYDLPWNPNRIEQRFGRVHRIGQEEVCHMWNLVASNTRESQVFVTLLNKIELQRKAYQGQVYDVLGDALSGAQLRDLLIQAIRYGNRPDVRAHIDQVIDATIGERVRAAIEEPPLAAESLGIDDLDRLTSELARIDERMLGPDSVGPFFRQALEHLGGRMADREEGRSTVLSVPPSIRERDRQIGTGAPVLKTYGRVTFDRESAVIPGLPAADLLSPGHPLVSATMDVILELHGGALKRGAVLVDDSAESTEPRVLVLLEHSIADARATRSAPHTVVSRRLEFVELLRSGSASNAGYAPHLHYRPPTESEAALVGRILDDGWLDADLEEMGTTHAILTALPQHLAEVRAKTEERVQATLAAVRERLEREIAFWSHRADELQLRVDKGGGLQLNADQARHRAISLAERLQRRSASLEAERNLGALPPVVLGGALIVPAHALM